MQRTTYNNNIKAGERILIVDDVISTGGTLEPILEAIEEMGAILQDIIIAIEKGDGRERLPVQPPKSSNAMFSGSTPRSSSMAWTASFIIGGPHR